MRYTQPQSGPYPLDQTSDLLAGGTLMALVLGSNQGFNLPNGTANTISGAVTSHASPSGVGAYNSGTAGDIGVANVSTGGSIVVHFWHGYYFSGGPTNAYLFGDYNGSSGVGLAGRHSNVAGHWGWFDGSSVFDGGETLTNGSLQTFVLVRDTTSGTIAIYRNGALKITVNSAVGGFTNTMAFGSIGPNQYATFGCESNTLLTGRIRFKAWNAAQVAKFTANPWQLFRSPQRAMLASGAPAAPTGTLASTLGNATLAASGAVLNAGAFASTLGNATMAAAGLVGTAPSGTMASTLSDATMSAAGAATNAGTFATSLAGASMSAAGIVINRGTFSATMGDATMAAAGTVAPNATGTFSSTLDGATMAAYGYNGVPPVLAGFFHRLPKNPRHVQRIP